MDRIKVTELDHIVLNVENIDRSLNFYVNVLGLQPERLDEFKAGKVMEYAQSQVLKIQKDMLDLKLQRKALQEKIQTSINIMQKILEYQKEDEKSAEKIMYYGRTQESGQK